MAKGLKYGLEENEKIRLRMEHERRIRHWTLKTMGEACGLSHYYIHGILHGEIWPTKVQWEMVVKAMGLEMDDVLGTTTYPVAVYAEPEDIYALAAFAEEKLAECVREGCEDPKRLQKMMKTVEELRKASLRLQPGEIIKPA